MTVLDVLPLGTIQGAGGRKGREEERGGREGGGRGRSSIDE